MHGTANEYYTPGGEIAFIARLVDFSDANSNKKCLYTSLVGRKSSLLPILDKICIKNIPFVHVTDFLHGKTRKWAIAWSFDTKYERIGKIWNPLHIRSCINSKQYLYDVEIPELLERLTSILKSLDVHITFLKEFEYFCALDRATWKREYRRKDRFTKNIEPLKINLEFEMNLQRVWDITQDGERKKSYTLLKATSNASYANFDALFKHVAHRLAGELKK